MPSPRSRQANEGSHFDAPLQSWEASPRDWGRHTHPPHHHYPPHMPYLAWSGGNNFKGVDHQYVDQNGDKKYQRQDHEVYGREQLHPVMHFSDRIGPPQPHGMGHMMGPPIPTSSGVEPSLMMKGESRDMMESDRRGSDKNRPVKLLALPEDRISLSETLCIVREMLKSLQQPSKMSRRQRLAANMLSLLGKLVSAVFTVGTLPDQVSA